MSTTIIECPACSTRYKMNKAIPEGGRSVKCARCGHQWRMLPEEPEELLEALEPEPDPAEVAAAELRNAPRDFGAGFRHEPSPTSFAETAALYGKSAAAEFAESTARYEPSHSFESDASDESDASYENDSSYESPAAYKGPASYESTPPYESAPSYESASAYESAAPQEAEEEEEPVGSSWEVRRGNLAAALASMGDQADPQGDDSFAEPGRTGHRGDIGEWSAESAAFRSVSEQTADIDEDSDGEAGFRDPDIAGASPSAFSDALDMAGSAPSWLSPRMAAEMSGEAEAENSVRSVLRTALDEQEAASADPFNPQGVGSAISRPVFDDPDMEEPSMDARAEWAAKGIATETPPPAATTSAPPAADASQRAFSDRWRSFAASGRLADAEAAETAQASESPQDAARFENDIAGIFRQQMQAKRSFGPAPRGRRAGDSADGFTDYDMESEQAQSPADDRYMADSPLDADAAALQAALEGSLRQRHAEETRSGSSGGLALAAAWAVFLSVLTGVMLAFVNFREDIVVALPGMGELYRAVGLGVEEQQIDFGKVHYRWTVADGKPMIEVTGQIINMTDREIAVPRVLINVRDKESADPVKATATLRSDPLAARETADFTLEFLSPSKSVSQIELAFAETNN